MTANGQADVAGRAWSQRDAHGRGESGLTASADRPAASDQCSPAQSRAAHNLAEDARPVRTGEHSYPGCDGRVYGVL